MTYKGWLQKRLDELGRQRGYVKPEELADATKMDSNENFAIPRQFQQEALRGTRNVDAREYPLGGAERLIGALSKHLGVPESCIGVGSGSDHILDLILANFATRRTRVLTTEPTFEFFEQRCRLHAIPMVKVPFSADMTVDMGELAAKAEKADILYLDSPNNPTGFQFPKRDLLRLVGSFDGLAIVDEAYAEFADYSLAAAAKSRRGLVAVGTLSKSFGLAGLRLGYFVAARDFAGAFNKVVQYPYPLSSVSVEAGISALSRYRQIREAAETVRSERQRIIEALRRHDAFEVFDSKANFVLFDACGAYRRIHTALAEQGISVRRIGRIGKHEGCLRVTVGTREMNSRFLLAVRDLLG